MFSTALPGNIDAVTDFTSGTDTIWLSNVSGSPFAALPDGALATAAFDILGNATAQSAATRVVYNTSTGALYFDVDGAVQFATLVGHPLIGHNDIFVGV